MQPKLFIATKAFIIKDRKVLVLRESGSYVDGSNEGRYDLPGGRLVPGERYNDALKREIFEETGLKVKVVKPIAVNEWRPTVRGEDWQIIGVFFECTSDKEDVILSEDHDSFLWISPEKHEEFGLIENLKPVFKQYLANKTNAN